MLPLGVRLVSFASMLFESLMIMGPGIVIPYLLLCFTTFNACSGPCISFREYSNPASESCPCYEHVNSVRYLFVL